MSPVTGRLNSFEWKVPLVELAPAIEAERPEIKGPVEAKPVNQIVLPEPGEKADAKDISAGTENKPAVRDVEEAEVIVPAAEPVKVSSAVAVKKVEDVKPPVADVVVADNYAEDEPRREHLVVDDPGVDESKSSQKAQNGLRLF